MRILAKILKKEDPSLKIILEGPTATFLTETAMNHIPEIDLCVQGEGEQTVLDFCRKGSPTWKV